MKITEDVEVGKVGDYIIYMDFFENEVKSREKTPCILWIHGGAWCDHNLNRKYRPQEEFKTFTDAGYVIACAEYRLTDEAVFPAQIEDCKCCVRYLRSHAEELNIDVDRIYAWGESAGGHLAEMLAATAGKKEFEGNAGNNDYSSDIKAACIWYAPARLEDEYMIDKYGWNANLVGHENPTPKELSWISSYTYIDEQTVPCLLMHGDADTLVDINQSNMVYDKMKEHKVDVKYVVVPGQGHGFFKGHKYYKMILDFFESIC